MTVKERNPYFDGVYPGDSEPDVTPALEQNMPAMEQPTDTEPDVEPAAVYQNRPPMEQPVDTEPDVTTPSVKKDATVDGMMNNIFGNSYLMTPEEQQRRIKRARTRALIGNLGQAMSAFVQIPFVNAGGTPVNVKPISTYEDEMRFIDRVNAARKEALTNSLALRRQERLDKETAIKEEKANAYIMYQRAVTDKNAEQATYWRTKWEQLEAGAPLEEAKKRADIAYKEAQTKAANAKAEAIPQETSIKQQNANTNAQNAATRAAQLAQLGYEEIIEDDGIGGKKVKIIKKGEQEAPPAGGNSGGKQKTKLEW